MRRRKLVFLTTAGVLAVALAGTTLVLLVYHEPAFYRRMHILPSEERRDTAMKALTGFIQLCDRFGDDGRFDPRVREWNYTFRVEQINSYLEEECQRGDLAEELERQSISSPRLSIDHDRLRLAFRYGSGLWSSVVSVDFRVWLVPKEVNVVALEVLARRAGALPISARFFLDQITEVARNNKVDITWYRHNGNPVALLRFQSDRLRPKAQLGRLELRPGMITIVGAPLDGVQQVPESPRID
jgi:hypothetical protein